MTYTLDKKIKDLQADNATLRSSCRDLTEKYEKVKLDYNTTSADYQKFVDHSREKIKILSDKINRIEDSAKFIRHDKIATFAFTMLLCIGSDAFLSTHGVYKFLGALAVLASAGMIFQLIKE